MINKLKISLLIAVLSLAVGVSSASAANLNYSSDTTVSIGGNNYTIASGSGATTVTVGTATLTVTVPALSTFVFKSPNTYTLNNDAGLASTCLSGQSQLTITGAATVVITPNTSSTCATGSGPAYGGGGTSATPATPATPANPSTNTPATPAAPATPVAPDQVLCPPGHIFSATTGKRCTAVTATFPPTPASTVNDVNVNVAVKAITANLTIGSKGDFVRALQEFLVGQNIGKAAKALKANGLTKNFGKLTKAALAEWQKAMGVSPASGYFGPKTRATIKNLGM